MHWRNSKFQVVYFILGKTHTADEAYRVLCELREEREIALNNVIAADLRTQAKIFAAQQIIDNRSLGYNEADVLNARADIAEVKAYQKNGQSCIDEAQREVEFLDDLIARVQPHRQYANLPDHESHQMAQREQWRYELISRAEVFVATQGTIPADHYASMRLHPDFETEIAPRITSVLEAVRSNGLLTYTEQKTPMQPLLLDLAKNIELLA